jgi:hypothetical protein
MKLTGIASIIAVLAVIGIGAITLGQGVQAYAENVNPITQAEGERMVQLIPQQQAQMEADLAHQQQMQALEIQRAQLLTGLELEQAKVDAAIHQAHTLRLQELELKRKQTQTTTIISLVVVAAVLTAVVAVAFAWRTVMVQRHYAAAPVFVPIAQGLVYIAHRQRPGQLLNTRTNLLVNVRNGHGVDAITADISKSELLAEMNERRAVGVAKQLKHAPAPPNVVEVIDGLNTYEN